VEFRGKKRNWGFTKIIIDLVERIMAVKMVKNRNRKVRIAKFSSIFRGENLRAEKDSDRLLLNGL
jgi:hypothetical protein